MSILRDIIDAIRAIVGDIPSADMDARLDQAAAAYPETGLDWRNSIVDLMKLVNMDSSLPARRSLAQELGYTGALDGSAEMNIWLHQQVMGHLR